MATIKEELQEGLEDYTMKSDEELIDMIRQFGCGESEFHTADIERLLKEKKALDDFVIDLLLDLGSRVADDKIKIDFARNYCKLWKGKHLSINRSVDTE